MKCPFCYSEETKVTDKRESEDPHSNRRRRECLSCNRRFTTYERVELPKLTVVKKDGGREEFDRDKVVRGIIKACEKRPIPREKIEKAVNEIENELRSRDGEEITSREIGDLVMEKLKQLDQIAYIRFASVYRSFTDLDSFENALHELKVFHTDDDKGDTTDHMLLVSTASNEAVSTWDKTKIIDALMKEANLSMEDAIKVSESVEKKIFATGIRTISVDLIRELVDNELFVRGFGKKLERQKVLGVPTYNLNKIIIDKSNENSNIVSNNPEMINLSIAETVLKQYALREIFSKDVADAHLKGAIHLHDLGYPVRVYCSSHSLEYLKKYGLKLANLSTVSTPAKYAGTLTGHLNTFLASMQAYYAGALGIGFLNIFYAPLLKGLDEKTLKQEAQYLIFSCSQNAFSRGGQTLFIDFNIHLGVPDYMKNVAAIGQSGKYMWQHSDGKIEKVPEVQRDEAGNLIQPSEGKILTYGDFEPEAQAFAKALLEVWSEGDSEGKPFPFPKCDLHVDQKSFDDPEQLELLKFACKIAGENGSPYFVFDREAATLSQCCRLKTKITDNRMITHPESMRFCGFQNVTINLPQTAYKAGKGNIEGTIKNINEMMEIAMKAHLEKRKFIKRLMESSAGPLWQIGKPALDGKPYVDLENATYIIGLLGLNECIKYLTGKNLHDDDETYKLGLKIISAMYLKSKELEQKHGLKVTLEETPGESASFRFAKMDYQTFPEAKDYVRGNLETGEIYYTNSIHFTPDAPIDILDRIDRQGRFNPLIESGSITHVFLGEQRPDAMSVLGLIKKTWENTQSSQIVLSPEFTVCDDCHKVSPGFRR